MVVSVLRSSYRQDSSGNPSQLEHDRVLTIGRVRGPSIKVLEDDFWASEDDNVCVEDLDVDNVACAIGM